MRVNAVNRIRILTGAIFFLALILCVRLYQIQIAHGGEYKESAERQYVHTTENLFERGAIYFTTKDGERVSAASLRQGYVLSVNPSAIHDKDTLYETLNAFVPLEPGMFLKKIDDPNDTYEVVATRLDEEVAQKIKAKNLAGISLYRDQWRHYPGDSLLAHAIGFLGYDGDTLVGRYGLERYYEDTLTRSDQRISVNFFAEIFSNLGIFSFDAARSREGNIVTSLEPAVSRALEAELATVNGTLKSKISGGIIMDPKTGEIFALSIHPGFNLNDGSGVSIEQFRNPLVENVYEMGSIIKPLTVAAGLDSGAITAYSTYYDGGSLALDDYTIYNYDKKGRGTVSMQEVLNQSLNTGAAHIVKTMGRTRFKDYFMTYGFGTEAGIDLPNETHGLVENLESPRDIELATASYGQGIAMTPIEAVRALAALGNGGFLVNPHIGTKIVFDDGTERPISYPENTRILKESTSEEISRMLTVVVDKALRGGTRKNERYSVAAKTGTAQIARSDGRGYEDDKYLHSFFGYFPSYDPQFIVFPYTVEPQGVQYASETLTDPFMNIADFLINYYGIPPDR